MSGLPDPVAVAFDLKLRRPGCAIVQAALGGFIPAADRFHVESWLLYPTPDMKLYDVPLDEFERLVAFVNEENPEGRKR